MAHLQKVYKKGVIILKKTIPPLFYLVLAASLLLILGACNGQYPTAEQHVTHNPAATQEGATQEANDRPPLQVVTTTFPQFDFLRQIAGDTIELTMLLSPGAESHSFEPTVRDMIAIYQADFFVYVCRQAEHWVGPTLHALEREDMMTIGLLDLVDGIYIDHDHEHHHDHSHSHDHGHSHDHDHNHDHGHSHDHDHSHDHGHHHNHEQHHEHDHSHDHDHGCDYAHGYSHDHGHNHDHEHSHHHTYDEHVWTSPHNVIQIVQALTDTLSYLDPSNAPLFAQNAATFISALEELDASLTQLVSDAARHTLIFGDRFPFAYLTTHYGLTAYAAFPGCSTDTYVTPGTIAFLIEKIQQENIPFVIHIELSSMDVANVLAEATGATLLQLHSAHNVTHEEFSAGITYLDIMEENILQLQRALNE